MADYLLDAPHDHLAHLQTYKTYKEYFPVARYITVRGQYEGYHAYENAPDEVAFLRNSHRHIFKWQATVSVDHDDRELEFFMVKRHIESAVLPFNLKGNLGSCEMQAEFIVEGLVNKYGPTRHYIVSVSEDGENDGLVEWRTVS